MRVKIIFCIICLALIAGGFYVWHSWGSAGASAPATMKPVPGRDLTATTTPAFSYSSAQYHFSLTYPAALQIETYTEQSGAQTITFEAPASEEGFQVYIQAYSGSQVTSQQFAQDEPSGVIQDQTNVVIDGTPAVMFFGNNSSMGDTREVWFIHGGYLYEVTTYKALDTWLAQIMNTWKFI